MGGFKHTNVADATVRTQYPSLGQVQDGEAVWVIATGTGDAMLAGYTPAITAVADGQQFRLRTPGANTIAAPTLSVGGTTARAIVKAGGLPLIAGDYTSGMEIIVRYKNLATPVYELLTPVQSDTSTFVPNTRKVETDETSLTGGGDLTADRVITAILASQAEAQAGTDNEKLMTALRVAQAITAQVATGLPAPDFDNLSSPGVVTANTTTNVAHGLGSVPTLWTACLRCVTADVGYAVGDEVKPWNEQGNNSSVSVSADATNISLIMDNGTVLVNKSTNNVAGITLASWEFVVRAWT